MEIIMNKTAKVAYSYSEIFHLIAFLDSLRLYGQLKTPQTSNFAFQSKIKLKALILCPKGTSLPNTWAPMPRPDMEVHTVPLAPGSSEYQNVVSKFQATARGMYIQKIERIQNPHLYKQYMVRKQKMDKDNGGNNERQLFHGTDARNISAINTQGFNRSFCGAHGKLQPLKNIVYSYIIMSQTKYSSTTVCLHTHALFRTDSTGTIIGTFKVPLNDMI